MSFLIHNYIIIGCFWLEVGYLSRTSFDKNHSPQKPIKITITANPYAIYNNTRGKRLTKYNDNNNQNYTT
jgi:hypothetical protein